MKKYLMMRKKYLMMRKKYLMMRKMYLMMRKMYLMMRKMYFLMRRLLLKQKLISSVAEVGSQSCKPFNFPLRNNPTFGVDEFYY